MMSITVSRAIHSPPAARVSTLMMPVLVTLSPHGVKQRCRRPVRRVCCRAAAVDYCRATAVVHRVSTQKNTSEGTKLKQCSSRNGPSFSLARMLPCDYEMRHGQERGYTYSQEKKKKNIARRNSRGAGGGRENKNTTWMLSFMAGPPRLPASGRETTMGDSEYTGPCSCLLNCVRSWREREALRPHTELLRQGASKACSSSICAFLKENTLGDAPQTCVVTYGPSCVLSSWRVCF